MASSLTDHVIIDAKDAGHYRTPLNDLLAKLESASSHYSKGRIAVTVNSQGVTDQMVDILEL
jgi:hypothetical protein